MVKSGENKDDGVLFSIVTNLTKHQGFVTMGIPYIYSNKLSEVPRVRDDGFLFFGCEMNN